MNAAEEAELAGLRACLARVTALCDSKSAEVERFGINAVRLSLVAVRAAVGTTETRQTVTDRSFRAPEETQQ